MVERVFASEGALGESITSPKMGIKASRKMASDESAVLFLTGRHVPVGVMSIKPGEVGELRTRGRMDTLYRAASMANAAKVILYNHGDLSESAVMKYGHAEKLCMTPDQ